MSIARHENTVVPRLDHVRDSIVDDICDSLHEAGVALALDSETAPQIRQQVAGIVEDVLTALGHPLSRKSAGSGIKKTLSRDIGRLRARDAVHPSVSLEAASRVFDIALPVLLVHLPFSVISAEKTVVISRALHRAIMSRVAPAAIGYVETLLEKLAVAQHEERLRISRQLHDHVSHNIAAAMQRLVLASNETRQDDHENRALDVANELLSVALSESRLISVELRQTVGKDFLHVAVARYIGANAVLAAIASLTQTGTPEHLPVSTSEEVYVVIREALRNAVSHAYATAIDVKFRWEEGALQVDVHDDGVGFLPRDVKPTSMGLLAMQERAEAIGADLTIESSKGSGTTVSLYVNHERGLV